MPDAPRPYDPDCIFCKIVAGAIPCHKVFEDDHVLALLDVGPLSRGHTLVIPKAHHTTLGDMPGDLAGRCLAVAAQLGPRIAAAVEAPGWNVLQNNGTAAGQVVMHVHLHIIPRREGDGLGYRWPAGKLDPAHAKGLLAAIASATV
jgi:histidine triad (HIT) family protein